MHRFALWKGCRIGVGRSFRNANHSAVIVAKPIGMGDGWLRDNLEKDLREVRRRVKSTAALAYII